MQFRLHRRRGTGRIGGGAEDSPGFAGIGKLGDHTAHCPGGEVKDVPLLDGRLLENGVYVGIATHDEELVWHALQLMEKLKLSRDAYNFQMLLGVDEAIFRPVCRIRRLFHSLRSLAMTALVLNGAPYQERDELRHETIELKQ